MSTSSDATQYSIYINMGSVANSGGSLNFYAADGYTDAMVAAIYEGLAALPWPEAVRPGQNIAVFRSDQSNTSYTTNYTTSPVSFQ